MKIIQLKLYKKIKIYKIKCKTQKWRTLANFYQFVIKTLDKKNRETSLVSALKR